MAVILAAGSIATVSASAAGNSYTAESKTMTLTGLEVTDLAVPEEGEEFPQSVTVSSREGVSWSIPVISETDIYK